MMFNQSHSVHNACTSRIALRLAAPLILTLAGMIPTHGFQSLDHRGSCYGKPTKTGTTVEVQKGRAYDITGYGTEYGHHCSEDQGRFIYRRLVGDFDVSAQVTMVRNDKNNAAKAGLIARASATDLAANFLGPMVISDVPNARHKDGGFPDSYTFDARTRRAGNLKIGGFDYHPVSGATKRNYPDVWLRLKRTGKQIQAFRSTDGKNWLEIPPLGRLNNYKPFGLELPDTAYVGFCVSSNPQGNPDLRSSASFRNIRGFEPDDVTSALHLAPVNKMKEASAARVLGGTGLRIGFASPHAQSGKLLWRDVRGVSARGLSIQPIHEVAP